MDWVPRSLNQYADAISRTVDYDDGSLNKTTFSFLMPTWAHIQWIVLHPHNYNKEVERFRSRFCHLAEAVDTFTANWKNEVNWWLPPLYQVCCTIQHAAKCKAKGTLVVPAWNSAPFWPILCPDGRHLVSFIHLWWSTTFQGCLFLGILVYLGDSLNLDSVLLALFVDFSAQPRTDNCGFYILSLRCTNSILVFLTDHSGLLICIISACPR